MQKSQWVDHVGEFMSDRLSNMLTTGNWPIIASLLLGDCPAIELDGRLVAWSISLTYNWTLALSLQAKISMA